MVTIYVGYTTTKICLSDIRPGDLIGRPLSGSMFNPGYHTAIYIGDFMSISVNNCHQRVYVKYISDDGFTDDNTYRVNIPSKYERWEIINRANDLIGKPHEYHLLGGSQYLSPEYRGLPGFPSAIVPDFPAKGNCHDLCYWVYTDRIYSFQGDIYSMLSSCLSLGLCE